LFRHCRAALRAAGERVSLRSLPAAPKRFRHLISTARSNEVADAAHARAELKGLAPDAIFAGVQTGQALSEHYASADIFGFPSQTETFGNVVLEGMSSGLAVVAFDYAAAAETIQHGQNGLLARLNDDEGFVQRVVELTVEPDRVQRLRQAGRVTVQSWDWQQIVAQVEAVMLQALAVP
jgi:glycosyltransferase involved in cell wall biosynthesis